MKATREMCNRPVRVAFVSHLSDLSGAPSCLLLILQLLDRERFAPIAICPSPGPLVQAISDLGISVHIVPKFPPLNWGGMRFAASRFLAKLVYRLVYIARLYFLLRSCRAQIVFPNTLLSSGATIAALLNGLPIVTHLHEYRLRFALTSPLRRWIVLHGAQHLIVVSEAAKTVAVEYGVDPTLITVAYAGVDTTKFVPAESATVATLRQSWGVRPDAILFGAAGALVQNKGFQDLLAAMPDVLSAIPDCHLLIAGSLPEGEDDSFLPGLEKQISELELEKAVHFLGQVADMRSFFSALDVFIIPSHEESFGLVALEAMSLEKPVIATTVGGLLEIVIPEETGLLVPPQQPKKLAAAMIRLGRDRALRQCMGKAGAERVRTIFTPSAYITAVEGALESVIAVRWQ